MLVCREVEDSSGAWPRCPGLPDTSGHRHPGPSVDVLTGVIKANITSRIAFTSSRRLTPGRSSIWRAPRSCWAGVICFLSHRLGETTRIQGAYVSEREIKRITDYIKEQGNPVTRSTRDLGWRPMRSLSRCALPRCCGARCPHGRSLDIAATKAFPHRIHQAARLIDDLERRGVVGEHEGSKPRG